MPQLTRPERVERRQELRSYARDARKNGTVNRRDAARVRAATRFNPSAVDEVLDDLMEEQEDDGNPVARLGDGSRDWKKFFDTILEYLPILLNLCPA